ncbi:MAG: FAD-dependent oxidoreductase [Aestuariivita sp.]|nr:FAD-dependent oxidoreductase [Aestuariivita sp.]
MVSSLPLDSTKSLQPKLAVAQSYREKLDYDRAHHSMNCSGLKVAVIGGGVAGLAAALAFARRDAQVTVYERSQALKALGAGLQLSLNGQIVLRALGVDGNLVTFCSSGTQIVDGQAGREIARIPGSRSGLTWYVHRADLISSLFDASVAAGVSVHCNQEILPSAKSSRDLDADLIIAADGEHSKWRDSVEEPIAATFSGQVIWRALASHEGVANPLEPATLTLGSGWHTVTYPLRDGKLMNIVAVEERKNWRDGCWQQLGEVAEFRQKFAQAKGIAAKLIASAEEVHVWALHLRGVASRWSLNRTVLVGDAAHPMLPFVAQGACMALEDAWILADAVAQAHTPKEGLREFEERRRSRVTRVCNLSRRNGRLFHLPRPWSWGLAAALRTSQHMIAQQLEWVYRYDATQTAPKYR